MFFGLMAFILNWIPNIGSIVAVLLPIPLVVLEPDISWIVMVLAFVLPATTHVRNCSSLAGHTHSNPLVCARPTVGTPYFGSRDGCTSHNCARLSNVLGFSVGYHWSNPLGAFS